MSRVLLIISLTCFWLQALQAQSPPVPPEKDPLTEGELQTRTFDVTPNFLSELTAMVGVPLPQPDPFAATYVEGRRLSTRAVLEKMGLPFPEGAAVFLDPVHHRLHARHTAASLDVIQALVTRETEEAPTTISFTMHLIRAPGPMLRKLASTRAGEEDQSAALKQLLADAARPESGIRVLQTAFLENSGGGRASLEAGTEYAYHEDLEVGAKGDWAAYPSSGTLGSNAA